MKPERAVRIDRGVSRVVAPGEADYHVRLGRERVDYLSLPFVSPLSSNKRNN